MAEDMGQGISRSLGRLCEDRPDPAQTGDLIISAPAFPGIERIEARFFGDVFEPHRHDTYALGLTLQGVQTFHYRGEKRYSLPGNIIVLHPDEIHDGGAATEDGLRYRMLYLEPSLLLQHLNSRKLAVPFVAQPVLVDETLRLILAEALASLDEGLDELFVDDLVSEI